MFDCTCTYRQRAHPDLEKRIPYSKWKDAVPTRFWRSFDIKIKQKTVTKASASRPRKARTPTNREASDTEIHVYTVRPCNVKIRNSNSKPELDRDIEIREEEAAVEENTRSAVAQLKLDQGMSYVVLYEIS